MASKILSTKRTVVPTLVPLDGFDDSKLVRSDPTTHFVDVIHAFSLVLGEQRGQKVVHELLKSIDGRGSSSSAMDLSKFSRCRWKGNAGIESIIAPLEVVKHMLCLHSKTGRKILASKFARERASASQSGLETHNSDDAQPLEACPPTGAHQGTYDRREQLQTLLEQSKLNKTAGERNATFEDKKKDCKILSEYIDVICDRYKDEMEKMRDRHKDEMEKMRDRQKKREERFDAVLTKSEEVHTVQKQCHDKEVTLLTDTITELRRENLENLDKMEELYKRALKSNQELVECKDIADQIFERYITKHNLVAQMLQDRDNDYSTHVVGLNQPASKHVVHFLGGGLNSR